MSPAIEFEKQARTENSQQGAQAVLPEDIPERVKQSLPKHVALIMDGNGRWAQAQGQPRVIGHKAGVKAVKRIVRMARELEIASLTLFAFSSENWRRPEQEVSLLMELFFIVLQREVKALHKHQVKLNIIGDISRFSPRLQQQIHAAQIKTAANTGLTLNIAANYGGRWDIVQATQELANKIVAGEMTCDQLTEESVRQHLCTDDQAEVDLLIRTGGEYRLSNFVLWQAAYAELVFTDTLWPDFDEQAFQHALDIFASRQRRFGLTGNQIDEIRTF